ncbi:MAG: bifunctional serine/threonine-protein kinase/formylglycine-generating enzyme family protein [Planctomycetota bacterium]|nr:bifunctional serine/threonine-protein kinase/formylglycine-generating enzyme family protein [Planctomycetota bacterium]
MSGDQLGYLLKLAVQNGDITPQEAKKVGAYTRSKQGDINLALGVLVKHHGLTVQRRDWLLSNVGSSSALTISDMGASSAAPPPPPPPPPSQATAPQGTPIQRPMRRPMRHAGRPTQSYATPNVGSTAASSATPQRTALTQKLKPKKEAPLPRKSIGNCELKSLLGKGAMGAVYRGFHNGFDRDMAVKLLPAERTSEARFVSLFKKEAQALVRVLSEHVVRVFDVGEEDGQHYITMELVEGSDLKEVIKEHVQIEPKLAARFIRDAARGLGAAHKEGLVHRDIKPDNLMITNDGMVKVADFGLAIDTSDGKTRGGFKKRSIVGTPYYMPPEQADGSSSDGRADVYSLGCTLFHAVTGDVPFRGKTLMDILVQHVNKEPPNPKDRNHNVDDQLANICLKMMAKDVDERFQTMKELADVLEDYLSGGEKQASRIIAPAPKKKQVLALADRPIPKLPEPPPVKGFAISSSVVSVIVIVLLILLNVPTVKALSIAPPPVPTKDSLVLKRLESELRENVTDKKAFKKSYAIFLASFPKLEIKARKVRTRVLATSENVENDGSKEAEAAFEALRTSIIALTEKKDFLGACAALARFPTKHNVHLSRKELEALRFKANDKLMENESLCAVIVAEPGGKFSSFAMDRYEVTNEEYADFLQANEDVKKPLGWRKRSCPTGKERLPVVGVSFKAAAAYAKWNGKRLPTSDEWRYAASGGRKRQFPWGNYSSLDFKRCNSRLANKGKLLPVLSFAEDRDGNLRGSSSFGMLNMSGNAAEWTINTDAAALKSAYVSGGSFKSHIFGCQSTSRVKMSKTTRRVDLGFRCVKDFAE